MVVETAELPVAVGRDRPVNRPGYRNGEIPISVKVKARNLYLHQALPFKAIGDALGLTVPQLNRLSHRERWPVIKRANKARLTKAADAQDSRIQTEVLEAIASIAEEHALSGLQKVGATLQRSDRDAAKDFQAYTSGVKNLTGVAMAIRKPELAAGDQSGSVSFNVFFAAPGAEKASEAPKQVTEIEGKKLP